MGAERDRVLLEEIDRWRAEGLLDEDEYRFMRSRYEPGHPLDAGDAPGCENPRALGAAAMRNAWAAPSSAGSISSPFASSASPASPADRLRSGTGYGSARRASPGLAPRALQLVGGVFLGAALVVGILALGLEAAAATTVGFTLAAWAAWASRAWCASQDASRGALHHDLPGAARDVSRGEALAGRIVEATDAGVLVVLAALPFFPEATWVAGALAAAGAAGLMALNRGASPAAPGAMWVVALGLYQATGVDLFAASSTWQAWAFWLGLLAYGALLLQWRHARWTSLSLALLALPLTLAFLPVLDHLGVVDAAMAALATGVLHAALFALGFILEERGLVAAGAIGLALATLAFAFSAGGALLAIAFLLGLGLLLVWQGAGLVDYFRAERASDGDPLAQPRQA